MFLTKVGRSFLLRNVFQRPLQLSQFSDDGSSSSDDEKKKPQKSKSAPKPQQGVSAADKLNSLLASMNTESATSFSQAVKIPQAGGRKQKLAQTKPVPKSDQEKKPKDIVEAAKQIADLVGDKTKQTEAELLSKLLSHVDGGSSLGVKTDGGSENGQTLSDLIVSMQIDRTKKQQPSPTRGDIVRNAIASRRAQRSEYNEEVPERRSRPSQSRQVEPVPYSGSIDLFGQRLGIFTNPDELKDSPDILKTWEYLHERELKLAVMHPPANYYEKMIHWTEEGKIWKFPIDNEQGLEEEAKVDFTEHIFLEQHLEGWCPNRGPVRHFMELVCVGLSKNPYITAQEKKEHIMWYRDYFESKKDLLKQVIVDRKETGTDDTETKAIKN